jgi:hypothetical protein
MSLWEAEIRCFRQKISRSIEVAVKEPKKLAGGSSHHETPRSVVIAVQRVRDQFLLFFQAINHIDIPGAEPSRLARK